MICILGEASDGFPEFTACAEGNTRRLHRRHWHIPGFIEFLKSQGRNGCAVSPDSLNLKSRGRNGCAEAGAGDEAEF
jgi:hypothetical protein